LRVAGKVSDLMVTCCIAGLIKSNTGEWDPTDGVLVFKSLNLVEFLKTPCAVAVFNLRDDSFGLDTGESPFFSVMN
jgi:hypothetical protein